MSTPYKTFSYFTFGCKVNFADSSFIARQLIDSGYNQIPFEDYTQWYEEKVLGSYIIKNYDIYYYRLYDSHNIAMVIYINKEIKKNIIESCNENNFKIKHLGIDIFSANISLNQIYKPKKITSYILWKVHKNNIHYRKTKGKF